VGLLKNLAPVVEMRSQTSFSIAPTRVEIAPLSFFNRPTVTYFDARSAFRRNSNDDERFGNS